MVKRKIPNAPDTNGNLFVENAANHFTKLSLNEACSHSTTSPRDSKHQLQYEKRVPKTG